MSSAYSVANDNIAALTTQNGQYFDVSNGQEYIDALKSNTFSPWNKPKVTREAMSNLQAQSFNSAEAQKNRDWQTVMSNTAHQREVADLQAAGLNTWLSANGDGASTPGGASASASNSASAAASQTSPVFSGLMQILSIAAQLKGVGANETRAAASMLSATANQERAKAASLTASKAMDGETKAAIANQKLKIQEMDAQSKIAYRLANTQHKQEALKETISNNASNLKLKQQSLRETISNNAAKQDLQNDLYKLKAMIAKKDASRKDVLAAAKLADDLNKKVDYAYRIDPKTKKVIATNQFIKGAKFDPDELYDLLDMFR